MLKQWPCFRKDKNIKEKNNFDTTKSVPYKWVVKDLSSSPGDCHILNQNGQYSSNVNTPFQMPHPLQLWAVCDDQVAYVFYVTYKGWRR